MGRWLHKLLLSVAAFGALLGAVQAASLLDETNIVGLPNVAAPAQFAFSTTGASVVTLTDFATPAAFTALQMVVTANGAVVGTPATINPATHTASATIDEAGTYEAFIVGLPSASAAQGGFGSFGVCVALTSSPNACTAEYSNTLATPTTPTSQDTSTVNTTFMTTSTAGNYTITLTDDKFPSALQPSMTLPQGLSAGIFGGTLPVGGIPNLQPGATQVPLAANTTYQLLIVSQASATTNAGLYGVRITDPSPSGVAVFDHTFPVGELGPATTLDNPSAQSLTLALTDYGYPEALTSLGAAVTQGGTLEGDLLASGPAALNAAAGSLDVWTYAVAGAQPGVYKLELTGSSGTLRSTTQVVNPGASGSYAFIVTIPSAGTYKLIATDFEFPGQLASLVPTVAQNGTVLTQNASGDFTAAAGVVVVLVDAAAPAGGSGTFDLTVETTAATPSVVFEQTQAVGGVFNSQPINLGTSGGFAATLTDLGFPQSFSNSTLALFVSHGGQVLGKIYGGGSFSFPATPGQYVVTLVAIPNSQAAVGTVPGYGLYTVNVANAAPTESFTASASSTASGTPITLTWSSQYATSCTAGGASDWNGSEPTSGSLAVSLASTATLTLSCTGPGGAVMKSATVSVTASSGGGGGGAIGAATLAGLAALAARAMQRRSARRIARSNRARA